MNYLNQGKFKTILIFCVGTITTFQYEQTVASDLLEGHLFAWIKSQQKSHEKGHQQIYKLYLLLCAGENVKKY